MSMIEWASKEAEIACKKENPDWDSKSFDYGCSCYQSALKAYKSLCEDGHSGASFWFTKNILIRLMEGLPLTPIEDVEENWMPLTRNEYQCRRMPSLFKNVGEDGSVKYKDIERAYCIDVKTQNTYTGSLCNIIDELFPIQMPYYPEKAGKYKVYVEEFIAVGYDGDTTDYNTRAVLYIVTPDGNHVNVDKFYGEKNGKMEEISVAEFQDRKQKEKILETSE